MRFYSRLLLQNTNPQSVMPVLPFQEHVLKLLSGRSIPCPAENLYYKGAYIRRALQAVQPEPGVNIVLAGMQIAGMILMIILFSVIFLF